MKETIATEPCTIDIASQDGPVDIDRLDWPGDCGGEVVFVGRTRNETHPKLWPLEQLEYEAYGPMASKQLDRIAQGAAERWPCRVTRIAHAQGAVPPGSASVVIQVATPHRGDAFEACRYLIDRLKHELTIWKIQVWQQGKTFVEGFRAPSKAQADYRALEDHT